MKLAEALILRSDRKKRLELLRERLDRVAKVQEGDLPVEEPSALLDEVDRAASDFTRLVQQINRTNATVGWMMGGLSPTPSPTATTCGCDILS